MEVDIPVDGFTLKGDLMLVEDAKGLVIFVHGSGSSRLSPRNRNVALELNERGLHTLLFDLLTIAEEPMRVNVFDIELLAHRLITVTRWVGIRPELKKTHIGYFGASTGAAAALLSAAALGDKISAVVSRGGRADLAGPALTKVKSPTLLIVGEDDDVVLRLNRQAQRLLTCENRMAIIPGATHLFEEEGAMEQVSALAGDWFLNHMAANTEGRV